MNDHRLASFGFRTREVHTSWPVAVLMAGICINLAGCRALGDYGTAGPSAATGFSGNVHGGQQPIAGARIQLYAAGTTGDGSSATALIAATVTTSDGTNALNANANAGNANNFLPAGSFTITGDYTCPSPSTQVYIVSTGGNPGLPPGGNNSESALMTALGPCGGLTPSTYIVINELTTVASIAPVLNFIRSYSALGSGSADASQLALNFSEVQEYADTSGGTVPGPALPSGYYASSREIRTLGDILATCVDSSGGEAGTATACGQLFQMATPQGGVAPTDTIQVVIDILENPTVNVAALYSLRAAASPFQPALSSAPASWSLPITLLPTTFSPALNSTSIFTGGSIIAYWPMPLHNVGIPGQTSAQILARFSSDVLNKGYARVIILCGANDIFLSVPNLTTELPANLQAMAAMARSAGIEPVLGEMPPVTSNGVDMNAPVDSLNAAIIQMAQDNGYLLVDYNTPLRGHLEYFVDGVHPNAAGYAVMEKALSGVVLF